jgi:hypothetical protein
MNASPCDASVNRNSYALGRKRKKTHNKCERSTAMLNNIELNNIETTLKGTPTCLKGF